MGLRETAVRGVGPGDAPATEHEVGADAAAKAGGGRAPLTAEQQQLARKYIPMAKSLAWHLKQTWPTEGDDFVSAGMLALVEAAQSFDPSRNVKFSTFARYRIWGALRDIQRRLVAAGYRSDAAGAPTFSSLTPEAEERGKMLGTVRDDPVGAEFEAVDFVEGWLRKLPARHAAACRELYINGLSQGEAAEVIGCSKSRLSVIHKEAREMLNDVREFEERRARRLEAMG